MSREFPPRFTESAAHGVGGYLTRERWTMQALQALLRTDDSWARFWQRIALAAVMFPHGAQKVFGWFGGFGYHATLDAMSGKMGIPKPLVVLVMLAEALGSIGLLFGALTRVAAFGISAVMVGAVVLVHRHVGFFMNWTGVQGGEGLEYHVLALALSVPLMVWGAGHFSIDGAIARRVSRMRPGRGAPYAEHGGVHAPVVGRQVWWDASG
jgi:putative oxidoreductase